MNDPFLKNYIKKAQIQNEKALFRWKEEVSKFYLQYATTLPDQDSCGWQRQNKNGVRPAEGFCVLEFATTKSLITDYVVQRAFRVKFNCDAPSPKNIRRWSKQFEESGCLCKGKSSGRPRSCELQRKMWRESVLHSVSLRSP